MGPEPECRPTVPSHFLLMDKLVGEERLSLFIIKRLSEKVRMNWTGAELLKMLVPLFLAAVIILRPIAW